MSPKIKISRIFHLNFLEGAMQLSYLILCWPEAGTTGSARGNPGRGETS
jgi:hypothetical protein